MLKDDYFVRGAGLPGRFRAEKVEFHWGPSNASDGSEHSVNGRRYPVESGVGDGGECSYVMWDLSVVVGVWSGRWSLEWAVETASYRLLCNSLTRRYRRLCRKVIPSSCDAH
ncbi:hypothetical protein NHX12_030363, partial [Muraenolepis orangiensis]